MVHITSIYQGQKHCQAQHQPSGSILETDAPKDNQGLGEKFSPTDLIATALGTCILTTMALIAERDGIDLRGSKISVDKAMSTEGPRRISSLKTVIELSKNIPTDYRRKLELIAKTCPVQKSLHPELLVPIDVRYTL